MGPDPLQKVEEEEVVCITPDHLDMSDWPVTKACPTPPSSLSLSLFVRACVWLRLVRCRAYMGLRNGTLKWTGMPQVKHIF